MTELRAEIISIGDEITSGFRLDTNSQWISQRLGEVGIQVAFHSTVGDDLLDNINVFRHAASRVDVMIATGGLGPTADDLTRQAIANMANVELVMDQAVLDHIRHLFESRGREMPNNNEVQAWFPEGSKIINNPEGSAPGIDFESQAANGSQYRIFALPGVPVEMKQMWELTVEPELRKRMGKDFVIHHHTIHCFGSGESHIESLLPGLVTRGRDPQVGITASSATITLRVSTRGETRSHCLEKMQATIATIHESLGDLVFGENGIELHEVVVGLLRAKNESIAILDAGLNGSLANLFGADASETVIVTQASNSSYRDLKVAAVDQAKLKGTAYGLAIGPIDRDAKAVDAGESFYDVVISDGDQFREKRIRFSGHSGWREDRAIKEVLNFFRLHLIDSI